VDLTFKEKLLLGESAALPDPNCGTEEKKAKSHKLVSRGIARGRGRERPFPLPRFLIEKTYLRGRL